MRNICLPEQRIHHREHCEGHDKQADTAIGEHGAGEHHRASEHQTFFGPMEHLQVELSLAL
jgi:hypothetical protein